MNVKYQNTNIGTTIYSNESVGCFIIQPKLIYQSRPKDDYRIKRTNFGRSNLFLLGTQALRNLSKTTACLLWPRPTPVWTKSDPNVTKDDCVMFVWLVFPCRKTFFPAKSANFSTNNVLKKTTCLRWTLYIGHSVGRIRQVWLYLYKFNLRRRTSTRVFLRTASNLPKWPFSTMVDVILNRVKCFSAKGIFTC